MRGHGTSVDMALFLTTQDSEYGINNSVGLVSMWIWYICEYCMFLGTRILF